ncbi:MAG: MHYT domain-containing protein [Streptosporangiaceae bacterium]
MLTANNFTYGLLTPGLAFLMSCLGAFLGLRCASRALACQGAGRARWLALGAFAFGSTGVWVMHFTAMLGYSIPAETIRYDIPMTLLSLVIAVAALGIGLFTAGFAGRRRGWQLAGAISGGIGLASVHYVDMAGMRMAAGMAASPLLLAITAVAAVAGMLALLWVVPRLHGGWPTVGAALVAAAFVSGLHYCAMAVMRLQPPAMGGMSGMAGGGASAAGFLLPLIVGISVVAFILTTILALAPTAEEMRADAELMERIGRHRMARQLPMLPGTTAGARPGSGPAGRAPLRPAAAPAATGRGAVAGPRGSGPGPGAARGPQPAAGTRGAWSKPDQPTDSAR